MTLGRGMAEAPFGAFRPAVPGIHWNRGAGPSVSGKKAARQKNTKKARAVAGVSDDGTGLPSGTEAGRVIGFGENYCMLWPAAPTVWGTQQLALSSPEAATKASAIFVEVTVSDRAVSTMMSMAMLPAAPT